jgi:hypothetical protein
MKTWLGAFSTTGRTIFDDRQDDFVIAVDINQDVELAPQAQQVVDGQELLGLLVTRQGQAHEDQFLPLKIGGLFELVFKDLQGIAGKLLGD